MARALEASKDEFGRTPRGVEKEEAAADGGGKIKVEERSEGGGALGQEGAMHVVPVVPAQWYTLSSRSEPNATMRVWESECTV